MKTRSRLYDITIEVPSDWRDITDEENKDAPITLAKPDGVGALQFSIAMYKSGKLPAARLDDLVDLSKDFGKSHHLGAPFDETTTEGDVLIAGASYRVHGDFIRAWHVSDRKNFALVTYTCENDLEKLELKECEEIVNSILFNGTKGK